MLFLPPLLIASLALLPQDAGDAAPARGDLVALRVGDLRALFADPKDRGLRRALELVGPRLAELPAELGQDADASTRLLPLLRRLVAAPFELRAGFAPESPAPFHAQLELRAGSADGARAAETEFESALEAGGLALGAGDASGLRTIPDVGYPAWAGARGEALVVAVGQPPEAPLAFATPHLPSAATPAFALRLDLAGGFALARQMGALGPELEPALAVLEPFGLTGARVSVALGLEESRAVGVYALEGAVSSLRASGLLPGRAISVATLRAIPQDALWAAATTNNLRATLALLRGQVLAAAAEEGVELPDPIELLMGAELELERDLLAHLGSSLAVYASETTGGGGLASVVMLAETGDGRALTQTLGRLEGRFNALVEADAEGYVQVRVRMEEGLRLSTLTFPGLPIPLQPTWTATEGFVVLGMTSEAALAAARHLRAKGPSLVDAPGFAEQLAGPLEGLYGLAWLDAPRLVRDGYGWASLGASALANALRSRAEPTREPGSLLPPFAELARGARPTVVATRVVGEDLVQTARMDRSLCVTATALAGLVDSLPLLMALPGLGVATARSAPVVEQAYEGGAFEDAPFLDESTVAARRDLMELHYACAQFALFNGGEFPSSLELLLVPDENGASFLEDESTLFDPWGAEYRYAPPAPGHEAPRIYTLGRDGAPGGEGPDADLSNLDVLEEMRSDR